MQFKPTDLKLYKMVHHQHPAPSASNAHSRSAHSNLYIYRMGYDDLKQYEVSSNLKRTINI